MRHLVTIQKVTNIEPIEGADRIVSAKVQGWPVVILKGVFNEGALVAYYEVDTLLPVDDPRYKNFASRGTKTIVVEGGGEVTGHVLRTMRMRGVLSQGLVLPLQEAGLTTEQIAAAQEGQDITKEAGVFKYEEPAIASTGGLIVGNFDTRFAPKSDAERVQTLTKYWNEIVHLDWIPTVKADGSSHTFVNDGGSVRMFSRNKELSTQSTTYTLAEQIGLVAILLDHPGMAIQAELVGPGIQKNRLKLRRNNLLVFAVYQHGVKVPREQWDTRLEALAVPALDDEWRPHGTVDEMIEKVATLTGNITKGCRDEGVVFHLAEGQEIPSWMDRNSNFKIINNTYLLKHKI